jgi:electron transfer flavoprotein alpha subunit
MSQPIIVVAFNLRGQASPLTWELLTVGRRLADASGTKLLAVLPGGGPEAAKELIERGADRALWTDHDSLQSFNEELHTQAILEAAKKENPAVVLLPANVAGRTLACRLAVKLGAGLAMDVTACENGKVQRGAYSGNLIADVEFKSPVRVMTVSAMLFPPAPKQTGRTGQADKLDFNPGPCRTQFKSFQAEEAGELDLGSAERIVAGGRGVGGAAGFSAVRDLAHALGAAVAASRAAVDSGWIPYRHQVGLTGRTVRPKLYVACGISGQIQHLAGMSGSNAIVAINTDSECPMMQQATFAVPGNMFELIPHIVAEVKKRKGAPVAA